MYKYNKVISDTTVNMTNYDNDIKQNVFNNDIDPCPPVETRGASKGASAPRGRAICCGPGGSCVSWAV